MKRFFTITILFAFSLGYMLAQVPEIKDTTRLAAAQEDTISHVYKRHLERISVDGVKLSKADTYALLSDFRGVDYSKDWKKYSSQQKWGIGLLAGGVATTAVCLTGAMTLGVADIFVILFTAGQVTPDNACAINAFFTGAAVGAVAAGTGTYFMIHSGHRMRNIMKQINIHENMAPEVAFGLQQHGIGLAVNF